MVAELQKKLDDHDDKKATTATAEKAPEKAIPELNRRDVDKPTKYDGSHFKWLVETVMDEFHRSLEQYYSLAWVNWQAVGESTICNWLVETGWKHSPEQYCVLAWINSQAVGESTICTFCRPFLVFG